MGQGGVLRSYTARSESQRYNVIHPSARRPMASRSYHPCIDGVHTISRASIATGSQGLPLHRKIKERRSKKPFHVLMVPASAWTAAGSSDGYVNNTQLPQQGGRAPDPEGGAARESETDRILQPYHI